MQNQILTGKNMLLLYSYSYSYSYLKLSRVCSFFKSGPPVYRSRYHIAAYFERLFGKYICFLAAALAGVEFTMVLLVLIPYSGG